MTVYVMDKEYEILRQYEKLLNEIVPDAVVKYFTGAAMLLDSVREKKPDLIFMDIEAYGSTVAAKKMLDENTKINIVFASSDEKYVRYSADLFVSGHILKPLSAEAINEQFFNLRHPILAKMKRNATATA